MPKEGAQDPGTLCMLTPGIDSATGSQRPECTKQCCSAWSCCCVAYNPAQADMGWKPREEEPRLKEEAFGGLTPSSGLEAQISRQKMLSEQNGSAVS